MKTVLVRNRLRSNRILIYIIQAHTESVPWEFQSHLGCFSTDFKRIEMLLVKLGTWTHPDHLWRCLNYVKNVIYCCGPICQHRLTARDQMNEFSMKSDFYSDRGVLVCEVQYRVQFQPAEGHLRFVLTRYVCLSFLWNDLCYLNNVCHENDTKTFRWIPHIVTPNYCWTLLKICRV